MEDTQTAIGTFEADVTQYMRPNGRPETMRTPLSTLSKAAYDLMRANGHNFAAEVLMTGKVSLTIEDRIEEKDLAIRVVDNGPAVPAALEEMLDSYKVGHRM